jgi:hypothetical protein
MATTNITVRHRPNRIAFLVRPGELSDLERAAGICTLLWGGLHNPIIPVATKDDVNADALLGNFQVDVLFPVAESDAIKSFVDRYPYLMNPRLSARELFYPDWHTNKNKVWPAPGSEDTELGALMELEVGHGETEVYPRVQA